MEKRSGGFKRQRRNEPPRPKNKKKEGYMIKKCPHCGYEMRNCGAADSAGSLSWKCRNKKCGRRIWIRKIPVPPIPLVPTSLMSRMGG